MKIAPSLLSADFANLAQEIESVERAGADLLHLDIMDGHFVPNLTIGPPVISSLRKVTDLPLDAHLMVEEPSRYVDDLVQVGVNWISIHVEADVHLNRTLQYIRDKGVQAGVALNPGTPINTLDEILPDVDFLLVMSVNPGFGGQEFVPAALEKIRKLREKITSYDYQAKIEVDGGITRENLKDVLQAGGEIVVAGSAIFKSKLGAFKALKELREIANRSTGVMERA